MAEEKTYLTIIEPKKGWQLIDWRELLIYRDLLYFLILRDIQVLYKQTVLGFSWAIIRPVFSMVVFSIVFGGLAGVPSDGVPYPIFSYTALLPWMYFSTAVTLSTSSLIANAAMLTKVYFPRLIIPLTPVLAGLVDFFIASVILGGMLIWYGIVPTSYVILLPLLVAFMVLTSIGLGLWLSALTIQYRDIRHAITFLIQAMMYGAPVVWPVSLINDKFPEWGEIIRLAYGLYPMAGIIEGFRASVLGTTAMPWDLIAMGILSATFVFLSGLFYFRQMEHTFADIA